MISGQWGRVTNDSLFCLSRHAVRALLVLICFALADAISVENRVVSTHTMLTHRRSVASRRKRWDRLVLHREHIRAQRVELLDAHQQCVDLLDAPVKIVPETHRVELPDAQSPILEYPSSTSVEPNDAQRAPLVFGTSEWSPHVCLSMAEWFELAHGYRNR